MSEEEILETLTKYNLANHFNNTKFFEALNCLIIMYNQEKEKNENLNRYFENQKQNFIHKDKIKAEIEYLEKVGKFIYGDKNTYYGELNTLHRLLEE